MDARRCIVTDDHFPQAAVLFEKTSHAIRQQFQTLPLRARSQSIPVVTGFIAATNVNDVGGEYIRSGSFVPRSAVQTFSNAMDVGNPSNIARLRSLYGGDLGRLRRTIETVCVSDEQTLNEIRLTFERTGRVVDPHTAVGLAAAQELSGSIPPL